MLKLSDTHAILLVHAAQHENGSLYPLLTSIAEGGGRVDKSIAGLLKRGSSKNKKLMRKALPTGPKGLTIERFRRDGTTCYRSKAAA